MADFHRAGCCVDVGYHFPGGEFGRIAYCQRPVTWAGTHTFTHPRLSTVIAFACDEHKDQIDSPEPFDAMALYVEEYRRRRVLERVEEGRRAAWEAWHRQRPR